MQAGTIKSKREYLGVTDASAVCVLNQTPHVRCTLIRTCVAVGFFFSMFKSCLPLHDRHTSIYIGGRLSCNLPFTDDIDLLAGTNTELARSYQRTESSNACGMKSSTDESKVTVNGNGKVEIYMNRVV